MTINAIDPINYQTVIAAFLCIKYTDYESLLKIFGLLKSLYSFSPIVVNTDFDNSQIKALKKCDAFIKPPYIVPCLFHYSQNITKKLKQYKIIKKKMNKRGIEILHNLQILCFIDINKIKDHFKFLKEKISVNENEKNLMVYIENYWIKKQYDIFNYSSLIKDINKCKNRYVNKRGDKESENLLYSKLKSLNLLYFTNNVCETVHSKISNHLPNGNITKNNF